MFHFEVFFLLKKKKRRICALSTDWGVRVGKRRDPGCDGRLGLPAAVGKASRGRVLHIYACYPYEFFLDQALGPHTTSGIWDVENCPLFKRVCPCPLCWCSGQLIEFYSSSGALALGSCLLLAQWEVTRLVLWLLKMEENLYTAGKNQDRMACLEK